MKIVCDACAARYSIADDKVQGKVFKIRCKKCSNVIVVRGIAAAEPLPEPAAPAPAADAVWHLVIDQEQVGPFTAAEVTQQLAAGDIDASTFAWREGFADWLPLSQVADFAPAPADQIDTTPRPHIHAPTTTESPQPLAAIAQTASSDELFATSSPVSVSTDLAAQKLRAERNETSVLFSLSNLSQLAQPRRVASTPTQATPGEGSGLLDIRSMASLYTGTAGKATPASSIGSIDDLPVFASTGFSEPAVLVPTPRARSNAKLLYAIIAAMAALTVGAIVIVAVLLRDNPTLDKPVAVVEAPSEPKVPTLSPEQPAVDPASKPAVDPASKPAVDPASKPSADPASKPAVDPASKPSADPKPKPRTSAPKRAANPPPATPKSPPATSKPASAESCDAISCEIANYAGECCEKYKKREAAKSQTNSNLPAVLDKSIISAGVGTVRSRITACGAKSTAKGTVMVKVYVTATGGVSSVNVESTPDTGLGVCVSSALKGASFASTQKGGSFRIPFTF